MSCNSELENGMASDQSSEDGVQVKQETDVATDKCSSSACGNCIKLQDEIKKLLGKIEHLTDHNQNLTHDLKNCKSANETLKENEKDLKKDLENLKMMFLN